MVVLLCVIDIWWGWAYHTLLQLLPSPSIGYECSQVLYICWFWAVKELSIVHIIMSLGTTVDSRGGIVMCNCYLFRFSLSHSTTTASITQYWLWMFPDFIFWLVFSCQWTMYCPPHYEFRNYSGFAWLYCYLQLISGEVEPTTLYFNCFHHPVLAMNDPRFYIFAGFDPSKNYLLSTSLWI